MATDQQEVLDTIKTHLASRGIEADTVTPQADLFNDLGLDSLDTVELTLALEEQYGIEIPDSDLEGVATVNDAIALIEKKRSVSA